MTIGNIIAGLLIAMTMYFLGSFGHGLHRLAAAIQADRDTLQATLDQCEYVPHGISGIGFEVYRQGLVHKGAALYYARMVRSINPAPSKCLDQVLPERWPS